MNNYSLNYLQTHAKIVFFCLLLASCETNKFDVDISEIQVDIEINRFEQDLFQKEFASPLERTDFLINKYGSFYQYFCEQAIRIGRIDHPEHENNLSMFVEDPYIKEISQDVANEFEDISEIEERLEEDFKRYKYHFPVSTTPHVYTFISGFNYSIIRTDSALGFGLDMYLDTLKTYYQRLGHPAYIIRKRKRKFIEVDVMSGWLKTEYPQDELEFNLLEQIIHQGKLAYLLDAMVINEDDSIKMGYTPKQMKWCEDNEARVWATLIENEVLYSSDYDITRRYVGEAPFTMDMTNDSPGKIGVWVGLQIVRKYMDKFPDTTFKELMEIEDARKILNSSKYKPKI